MDPIYAVLGIPNDVDAPRHKLLLGNLGMIVAKRDIAKLWGATECPTIEEWKRGMDMYMAAEKVTYRSRGCPRKFLKIWGCWIRHYALDLSIDEDFSQ
mgnify:CR=1 FL=1